MSEPGQVLPPVLGRTGGPVLPLSDQDEGVSEAAEPVYADVPLNDLEKVRRLAAALRGVADVLDWAQRQAK